MTLLTVSILIYLIAQRPAFKYIVLQTDSSSYLLLSRYTNSTVMSAGDTPDILDA